MDYERLYTHRFAGVDQDARQTVWNVIAPDIYRRMGKPGVVLDPAAGRCEFMNAIPARERWIVDNTDYGQSFRAEGIKAVISDIMEADLPPKYFDGIFVSNFLEHLSSPEHVYFFLTRMLSVLQTNGVIAVLGPNFPYCVSEYFDCADHILPLSHVSVEEHLYAAGFHVDSAIARYLPFSFRGRLPASPALTKLYLHFPLAWKLLGKQFLILARPESS